MRNPVHDGAVSDEALRQQARDWLHLLASPRVKASDAERFERWVQTSAAHLSAFQNARRRWDTIESASRQYLDANPQATRNHAGTRRVSVPGRRAFLATAVGAAAAAGVAVVYPPFGLWPSTAEWGADVRTATGEQRTLALVSQVDVTLNTATSIRRETTAGHTTGIDLISGEAAVDLSMGAQPFSVVAGVGRSVAQAGSLQVRILGRTVCVTCLSGSARIEHPAGPRVLSDGQQLVYDDTALGGTALIRPDDVSAWRRGALVFDDVRLHDAIDEINRYRSGRVILMNSDVRNRTVTGRFVIASLDAAVAQIEHMFSLQGRSLPGGVLILS